MPRPLVPILVFVVGTLGASGAEGGVEVQVGSGTGRLTGRVFAALPGDPPPDGPNSAGTTAWVEVVRLSQIRDRRFPEPWVPELPDEGSVASFSTDSDGMFVLSALAAGRYRLKLRDGGPEDAHVDAWVDEGGPATTLELRFTVGLSLQGRVLDVDGRPQANVPVFVSARDDGAGGNALLGEVGEWVRSDSEGRFLLPRLRPGRLWITAGRRSHGFGLPVEVQLAEGTAQGAVELLLPDERAAMGVPDEESGGLGLSLAFGPGGPVLDGTVAPMPAHRAGLQAGDRILAIGGRPTERMSRRELVARCRGRLGTLAILRIGRGNEVFDMPLVREPFPR